MVVTVVLVVVVKLKRITYLRFIKLLASIDPRESDVGFPWRS